MSNFDAQRRQMLDASLLAGGLAATSGVIPIDAFAADKANVSLQLGWLIGGNQIGEVVAKRLGYYEQEGVNLTIQPGGPNIDGVAVVASGRNEVGQVSSSPSIMLATSQGIPVKCFAVGAQRHPYCFFSLQKNPVRKPADMAGKRVGIQATGMVLLRALLVQNKIAEKDVDIIPIGSDMTPLMSGQVDVVTGWLTNTTALKVLGKERVELSLWDSGVHLYALPYYATTKTLRRQPQVLAAFLRATARGWSYANANRDAAVDLLIKEYPNLNHGDERVALDVMLRYSFSELTRRQGWGAMDPDGWQAQISLYARLGQFSAKTPELDDVMTLDVLKATSAARLRA
ncbi:ABC transporter substrate-binding protein [Verminephrobacter eiseniae]|uniref:Thiamine pyrimidine synthase n=1 Tax=Verminephrobacter eiseniae (strain EF01-2) TaxID=391735 RepID=A1WNM1_VEREI|nr:ABC transporter substrate-binding protein [Verminephrobacter eiseniae]ABM59228.1 twin-arginine translocation pathway signal [Verminephrobacter eiseniae EF01-2]MCW5284766.1 nitrate ABC transporter substrate-binding protein [Verminephrobacter eiseniae]MCW5302472.1 nitrate ABC transporter substrate-binding protein [Verminephrobacter eiseniae]MCW8178479.1 nitrate ABC transporter substrate-binding protein [Verminephrobacter eiseniae]MCW8189293.1 nitrate ABC transporter substrate-binding protein 